MKSSQRKKLKPNVDDLKECGWRSGWLGTTHGVFWCFMCKDAINLRLGEPYSKNIFRGGVWAVQHLDNLSVLYKTGLAGAKAGSEMVSLRFGSQAQSLGFNHNRKHFKLKNDINDILLHIKRDNPAMFWSLKSEGKLFRQNSNRGRNGVWR